MMAQTNRVEQQAGTISESDYAAANDSGSGAHHPLCKSSNGPMSALIPNILRPQVDAEIRAISSPQSPSSNPPNIQALKDVSVPATLYCCETHCQTQAQE